MWKKLAKELSSSKGRELSIVIKEERDNHDIIPPKEDVFNFYKKVRYEDVQLVIVTSDGFTDKESNGLAFSSTSNKISNTLKTVFKAIRKDLYSYMDNEQFDNAFNSSDLTPWAKQGILLINTYLTTRADKLSDHNDKGWNFFIEETMRFLNDYQKPLVFIFMGNSAKSYSRFIDNNHVIIDTVSPNPLHGQQEEFINSKVFSKALESLVAIRGDVTNEIPVNDYLEVKKLKDHYAEHGVPVSDEWHKTLFNENGTYHNAVSFLDFRTVNNKFK